LLKPTDYSKPVNRGVQILLAIPMASFGILATGVGMLIFYFAIVGKDVPANAFYAGTLFIPVGLFCLVITWRLASGRSGREDGGVFSPLALRLGGGGVPLVSDPFFSAEKFNGLRVAVVHRSRDRLLQAGCPP
jgi:hypothetical protein